MHHSDDMIYGRHPECGAGQLDLREYTSVQGKVKQSSKSFPAKNPAKDSQCILQENLARSPK